MNTASKKMSKTPFLVFGCALLLLLFLALDVSGHRIEDDLEFSASGKQKKYEKGSESEHHESDYEKKGKKGKMGYEMKHGYVRHKSLGCISLVPKPIFIGAIWNINKYTVWFHCKRGKW